ncbi:MAG: hypothetical protein ACK4TN_00855 [Brevinematales bacterium]
MQRFFRKKWGFFFLLFPLIVMGETNQPQVEGKILPPLVATPEERLPPTYLVDGTNTTPFQETLWRRYDVVFFVAVPISFYLVMNILMIKNAYFYGSEGTYLSDTDWNYIYLMTFFIPLFTAYHDQVYVRGFSSKKDIQWNIPLYKQEF